MPNTKKCKTFITNIGIKMKVFKFLFYSFFAINFITTFSQKPNVIIIMADDMGYGDLGFHGNPTIKTPHLDKLAKESTNFSNFYVSPVCAPTRASLMTGRYNIRTGVFDTYSGGAIMATEETTIAEVFKENGYTTGIFGKWHLGDSYPSRPQDQGFDQSVWHLSGGIGQVGDVFNYYKGNTSYFDPILFKNGEQFQSKGYCSDVYTDELISFIKNNKSKSFLSYLSFNAPHTPLQVPDAYFQTYKDVSFDNEYYKSQGLYVHEMTEKDMEDARKVYAMISNIDDNVGRLIETLKQQKIYDDTIIIFMTDNGPEQYRYIGGYRGKKGQVREGGIHVPFYLKSTNSENLQKEISTPAAHIDVLPTLAELCAIEISKDLNLDGISFAGNLIDNTPIENRSLFFEWQRSYPEKYRNMSVIDNGFKLIGNTSSSNEENQFELYNLNTDRYEANDVSSKNPTIVNELKSKLDIWYDDIMSSKHLLNTPRIIIGTEHEKHTILNRNDARGMQLIWDDDQMHVRWDLSIIKKGNYKIICHFRKPIPKQGELVIRIGTQNFTQQIEKENTQTVTYNDVLLNAGNYSLDGWFYGGWKHHYTPFYIELIQL